MTLQGFRLIAASAAGQRPIEVEPAANESGNNRYILVRILPIIPLPRATP
jgi:hypothetical protein